MKKKLKKMLVKSTLLFSVALGASTAAYFTVPPFKNLVDNTAENAVANLEVKLNRRVAKVTDIKFDERTSELSFIPPNTTKFEITVTNKRTMESHTFNNTMTSENKRHTIKIGAPINSKIGDQLEVTVVALKSYKTNATISSLPATETFTLSQQLSKEEQQTITEIEALINKHIKKYSGRIYSIDAIRYNSDFPHYAEHPLMIYFQVQSDSGKIARETITIDLPSLIKHDTFDGKKISEIINYANNNPNKVFYPGSLFENRTTFTTMRGLVKQSETIKQYQDEGYDVQPVKTFYQRSFSPNNTDLLLEINGFFKASHPSKPTIYFDLYGRYLIEAQIGESIMNKSVFLSKFNQGIDTSTAEEKVAIIDYYTHSIFDKTTGYFQMKSNAQTLLQQKQNATQQQNNTVLENNAHNKIGLYAAGKHYSVILPDEPKQQTKKQDDFCM